MNPNKQNELSGSALLGSDYGRLMQALGSFEGTSYKHGTGNFSPTNTALRHPTPVLPVTDHGGYDFSGGGVSSFTPSPQSVAPTMNTSVAPSSTSASVPTGFNIDAWQSEFTKKKSDITPKGFSSIENTNAGSSWTPQDTIGAVNAFTGLAGLGMAWYGNKQAKSQYRDTLARTDKNISNQVQLINQEIRDRASDDAYYKYGLTGAERDAYVNRAVASSGVTDMSGRGTAPVSKYAELESQLAKLKEAKSAEEGTTTTKEELDELKVKG